MNRPFVIPVFLPHHGCPHRCLFCNQIAITHVNGDPLLPEKLSQDINAFLEFNKKQRRPVQIAFYGGNFLGLALDEIRRLLKEATRFVTTGKVDSIRFSTRPDTIDQQRLDIIRGYPIATIEIGAQSMDDQILSASNRGHTAADTENAVSLLQKQNYEIGIQMMVGLPGDDQTKSMATGRRIAALDPDFVRIYPAVVLAGSGLARLYQEKEYTPWPLGRCVTLVKKLYLLFKNQNIAVVRMGLQASKDLSTGSTVLAGPFHPAFGHLVHSEIFLDKAVAALASQKDNQDTATFKVHPRSISKMRGLKNKNIHLLKNRFRFESVAVFPDPALAENQVILSD